MAEDQRSLPHRTYEEIVREDDTGLPDFLSQGAMPDLGTAPIDAERYWSRSFYERENRFLWSRVWQMACLEDDIPNGGDCFVYEIADRSFIIVRTDSGIRAYYNACLHRGRKLITQNCSKQEFACPFHAITWSLEGELIRNPIGWDMPQWDDENSKLPQARVATWAGFVFICMDTAAPEFEAIAAPMMQHFEPYGWDRRYRAWWFEKRVRANWKATQEAFMESHHSQKTHPQLLPSIGDINSQYDFLNAYLSRQISAGATASPSLDPQPDEHRKIALMKKRGDHRVDGVDVDALPQDFRARSYLGAHARETIAAQTGEDLANATDAELLDYVLYSVFPNMTFWAGYGPKLVYRWRPEPGNPECSIMDIMWMEPVPEGQPKPRPAKKVVVDYDETMASQEAGSASLKTVFDQDFTNLPNIQSGMKSLRSGQVHFAQYSEGRIRYLHQFIDRFMATGEDGAPPPGASLDD